MQAKASIYRHLSVSSSFSTKSTIELSINQNRQKCLLVISTNSHKNKYKPLANDSISYATTRRQWAMNSSEEGWGCWAEKTVLFVGYSTWSIMTTMAKLPEITISTIWASFSKDPISKKPDSDGWFSHKTKVIWNWRILWSCFKNYQLYGTLSQDKSSYPKRNTLKSYSIHLTWTRIKPSPFLSNFKFI